MNKINKSKLTYPLFHHQPLQETKIKLEAAQFMTGEKTIKFDAEC